MENKETKHLSKGYVCRKIRLYSFLLDNGFKPVQVRPDREQNERLVWIFDDTQSLRDVIEEYYAIRDRAILGGENNGQT